MLRLFNKNEKIVIYLFESDGKLALKEIWCNNFDNYAMCLDKKIAWDKRNPENRTLIRWESDACCV